MTPWSTVLVEKLIVVHLMKKFPVYSEPKVYIHVNTAYYGSCLESVESNLRFLVT